MPNEAPYSPSLSGLRHGICVKLLGLIVNARKLALGVGQPKLGMGVAAAVLQGVIDRLHAVHTALALQSWRQLRSGSDLPLAIRLSLSQYLLIAARCSLVK